MKKQLIGALSVALFAVTSGAAVAGHGHDGEHRSHRGAGMHEAGDPDRMVRHLTRMLDLDETQQQTLGNITLAAKPEMDALRERADANRLAFHELDVDNDNYDAQLNELAMEKGAIATEKALLHGRLKSEINAVLTPEQRQQLSDAAKTRHERFLKHKAERSQTG